MFNIDRSKVPVVPNPLELTEIGIQNFKSFGSKQTVKFKRVNFLFGPNSHGKTSVVAAINLLLKKYIHRRFKPGSIEYIDNSPYAELTEEVVNRNSKSGKFTLEIKRESFKPKSLNSSEILHQFTIDPKIEAQLVHYVAFEFNGNKKTPIIEIEQNSIRLNLGAAFIEPLKDRISKILDNKTSGFINLYHEDLYISLRRLDVHDILYDEFDSDFYDETENPLIVNHDEFEPQELSEIGSIKFILANLFNSPTSSGQTLPSLKYGRKEEVEFIGPNRRVPHKSYSIGGAKDFLADKFFREDAVQNLNAWLRETDYFNFKYEFVLNKGNENETSFERFPIQDIIEYGVREFKGQKMLKLSEVGSGIGHIFQILLPFFSGIKVIVIQQPEIHLHPSLQVQLAKAIFDLSKKQYVQIIIETHSEHFIKAAQLEVAKSNSEKNQVLTKNDLNVIYVSKNEDGFSQVRQIGVDKTGAFTEPWPDDFFELSGDMSLERLRLSYQKRN